MFKILSLLSMITTYLIFNHKDEYTISSPRFNGRKMVLFVLATISLMINLTLMNSVFAVAKKNKALLTMQTDCIKTVQNKNK